MRHACSGEPSPSSRGRDCPVGARARCSRRCRRASPCFTTPLDLIWWRVLAEKAWSDIVLAGATGRDRGIPTSGAFFIVILSKGVDLGKDGRCALVCCGAPRASICGNKVSRMRQQLVAVVDDDPGMLKSIERLLRAYKLDLVVLLVCRGFSRGSAAGTANCLVLDIHLGGISGIDLRRRLASLRLPPAGHFHFSRGR